MLWKGGRINKGSYEDMGGVIFPEEELSTTEEFTTEGPGAIAFLGALVGSVGG